MALYATGGNAGLVVDVGYRGTHVVAVAHGMCLLHSYAGKVKESQGGALPSSASKDFAGSKGVLVPTAGVSVCLSVCHAAANVGSRQIMDRMKDLLVVKEGGGVVDDSVAQEVVSTFCFIPHTDFSQEVSNL